ncbi:MAG: CAAX prenyl protease-related protein [Terrimicrobiaceae bacterium]|nr:CAAX prenyl protease-related protein [Terrimicrobiaceae bacterium]
MNLRTPLAAYVVPFVIFMLGLMLVSTVKSMAGASESLLLQRPEFWVYPLQSLACAIALIFYWKKYDFGRGGWGWAIGGGLLALILWVSPQVFFGLPERTGGFDPTVFENDPMLYGLTVLARFFRLVIVVPLVEEIFWRGFLMRYLIREDFQSLPFGTYKPSAFFGVAFLFMLVHSMPDWPAAFLTGVIFNFVAVRTRSLAACIAAHALTNLILGVYIMSTRQWGFW